MSESLNLRRKLLSAGIVLTAVPLIVVSVTVFVQNRRMTRAAEKISQQLTYDDLKNVVRGVYALAQSHQKSAETSLRRSLKVARTVMRDLGGITIGEDLSPWEVVDQYSKKGSVVWLPELRIGAESLRRITSPAQEVPLVDQVQRLLGVTCTLFQRINPAGDMARVATNVLDDQGLRAVGTFIPHHRPGGDPDPVISRVLSGQTFVGRAFVVNDWYITAYEPIHDANHEVIGMLYVGVPQKGLVDLRRAIMDIVIGKTGYAWVLDGTGRYVISKNGRRDGEMLLGQPKLAAARIDELLGRAKALDEGEILEHVYQWSNDPERDPPQTKVSYVMYFAPWDWLIGAGTYREEFLATSRQVSGIGDRSNLVLLTVLILALAATLLTWLVISRDIARPITETNLNLSHTIAALEDRTHEMMALNQLGDLLQACNAESETYSVVANTCGRLWPDASGYLALFDDEAGLLRAVGSWGDVKGEPTEFGQDQCWAMRRGKAHPVLDPRAAPVCEHVNRAPCGYICVPMSAQGRVLGTLFLRPGQDACGEGRLEQQLVARYTAQMGSVLERYAPSLMAIRLRERLRVQSIRDPLTGLFNRRHMDETLEREVSRALRHQTTIGVMMIDLDHFKVFNDRYGHEAGDAALRVLGGLLVQSARGEDIACRLGGEEFVLLMPGISLENAERRAEQLREKIQHEQLSDEQGRALHLSASFGVAVFPTHGPTMDKALRAADVALYQAKAQGRNRVVVAETTDEEAAQAGAGGRNVASLGSFRGKAPAEGDQ